MLTQASHWMAIAGTAVDALLLCRVLMLRLQRVYVFITLACLVSVFFDLVSLWLANDAEGSTRVFFYSRFLYLFLFPLVGSDVFEEMKPQIAKLRKAALARLISGLFFAVLFGFLMSLFAAPQDSSGSPLLVFTMAIVLWAGSGTATLAFLWTLDRAIRAQNIPRPHNTAIWVVFWQLDLLAEVLYCFYILMSQVTGKTALSDVVYLLFGTYGIAITLWCILKLRALPSDVPSAPASAQS